jgi:hypothetical protein
MGAAVAYIVIFVVFEGGWHWLPRCHAVSKPQKGLFDGAKFEAYLFSSDPAPAVAPSGTFFRETDRCVFPYELTHLIRQYDENRSF